jgi:hypothetical protein
MDVGWGWWVNLTASPSTRVIEKIMQGSKQQGIVSRKCRGRNRIPDPLAAYAAGYHRSKDGAIRSLITNVI